MRKIELLLDMNRYNGYDIHGYLFEPDDGVVNKVLYVIHGMTEHMGRYEEFAEALTKEGIAVVGIDLKGHGKNNPDAFVASFGEKGWNEVLDELHLFYDYIIHRYINAKVYILGFSLGSFLLREYMNKYYEDTIAGAIIMGTGTQPSFILNMIMPIVKKEITKVGINESSPLIKKLSFGEYNKKFKPNRTSFDWLCSDNESIDAYIDDILCKKDISSGLFYDLLASMKRTSLQDSYHNVNKDIPILLISGKSDPVGNMGKGVTQVYKDMSKAGMKNVKLELLDNARHDLLHEHASQASLKTIELIKDFIK